MCVLRTLRSSLQKVGVRILHIIWLFVCKNLFTLCSPGDSKSRSGRGSRMSSHMELHIAGMGDLQLQRAVLKAPLGTDACD